MFPLCQYVMPNGSRCQSPALKNTRLCYLHGRQRAANRHRAPAIPLVFPEDRAAIQHNLHLILLATQEGRISPSVARAVTHVYRAASANLKAGPLPRYKSGRKCLDGEFRIVKAANPASPHRI